jgi:hypothetical protein
MKEITVVYPSDGDNGPEVIAEKGLLIAPGVAIICGNRHAVIEYVRPCEFFNGKYYEVVGDQPIAEVLMP